MSEFRFTIHGEPVAKGRGRIVKLGAHMGIKTPEKTRRYEDIVRNVAAQQWNGQPLIADLPITMRATFFRGIPASWSKKKQQSAMLGEILPLGKPDIDNLSKALKDGLNGIVYTDDSLIVRTELAKFYALDPRVEVHLFWQTAYPIRNAA